MGPLTAALVLVGSFALGCAKAHVLADEDGGLFREDGGRDLSTELDDAAVPDVAIADQGPWTAPGVLPPPAEVFCGEPTGADVSVDLVAADDVAWLLVASSEGWAVYANESGEYRTVASGDERGVRQIAVAPDGRIWVMPFGRCAVAEVSSGSAACEFMRASDDEVVAGMSVVSNQQQWVVLTRRIVAGLGANWGNFREFHPDVGVVYRDLWGDSSLLTLAGDGVGVAVVGPFTDLQAAPGVPAGDNSIVAGTDRSHLWFGSDSGRILQFDDPTWTVRRSARGRNGCRPHTKGLWADSQTSVFAIAEQELVRLQQGTEEQMILQWECSFATTMEAIAGAGTPAASEVFVAAVDHSRLRDACGPVVLLRYDGTVVRRM